MLRHVYMQCGCHATLTHRASLYLVGPTPAPAAQAQVPARQQQHAAPPLAAPPAQPPAVAFPPVAAAAARLLCFLRRCGAGLSEGVFEVAAEGIRRRLVGLRRLPPQLVLDVEAPHLLLEHQIQSRHSLDLFVLLPQRLRRRFSDRGDQRLRLLLVPLMQLRSHLLRLQISNRINNRTF